MLASVPTYVCGRKTKFSDCIRYISWAFWDGEREMWKIQYDPSFFKKQIMQKMMYFIYACNKFWKVFTKW